VDDNRDSVDSMRMLLEFLGAEVRVALDGETAIEVFREYQPAVVLLDLGMPEMDGYEVVRRLRRTEVPKQPMIVALTGWGQEEDRRRTREAGFDRHLTKPADVASLRSLLGSVDPGTSPGESLAS
jgi:CheY-like chemotaxis protein